jgi:mRNA interferase HicA
VTHTGQRRRAARRNPFVDVGLRNTYVVYRNAARAKRYLAKRSATFAPGKGDHIIVTLNGRRAVLPMHGGSKELGKGLWLAMLKQFDIKE